MQQVDDFYQLPYVFPVNRNSDESAAMLTLANLSTIRVARGLLRPHLASVTGIDVERIRDFETGKRLCEPWLDEALLISRALCVGGIAPLISSEPLTTIDLGRALPDDLDMLYSGVRLPLSLACRIAVRLGLPDPDQLTMQSPLPMQVWDVLEQCERTAVAGICPWCLAERALGQPHSDTCLPRALWGPRSGLMRRVGRKPKPERRGDRDGAGPAWGLRELRKASGMTQAELARYAGINASYMARLERCNDVTRLRIAEKFAAALHVDVAAIYRRDENSPAGAQVSSDAYARIAVNADAGAHVGAGVGSGMGAGSDVDPADTFGEDDDK